LLVVCATKEHTRGIMINSLDAFSTTLGPPTRIHALKWKYNLHWASLCCNCMIKSLLNACWSNSSKDESGIISIYPIQTIMTDGTWTNLYYWRTTIFHMKRQNCESNWAER
jgi:hypothetical protein